MTPVWYMRQAGRSQAEYRKIKEKYTLFEITKEPELCARVTELPVKEYGVDAAILYKDIMSYGGDECKCRTKSWRRACI